MIDRAIATHTAASQNEGQLVNRVVHRVSQVVGIPAFFLMLAGLVMQAAAGANGGHFPGPSVVAFTDLFRFAGFSPNYLMSLGVLGLCLVPVISVIVILVYHLRARRWREVAVSLLVIAILCLSLLLGKG